MKLRRWGVAMTPLKGLGRRTEGRTVVGPSFPFRVDAEIEASRLDREMNRRDDPDSVLMFAFATVRLDEG